MHIEDRERIELVAVSAATRGGMTGSVTLFDQGLIQILQASVTGLAPKQPYQLVLAENSDGTGNVEQLANFMTNPAGSAIVNASGPIRQVVQGSIAAPKRWLAIRAGTSGAPEATMQTQLP